MIIENVRSYIMYIISHLCSFLRPSPLPSFDSARKLDVREIAIFGGARKLNERKLNERKLNARKLNARKLNARKLNTRKLDAREN